MRALPALAAAATAALLLTACTGGDDDATPAGTATGGASTSDDGAATDGDDGSDAGSAPEEVVVGGASEDCLAGTWELDLAAMQGDLRSLFTDTDGSVDVHVEGTTTYEFTPGGAFAATVDSSSSMTMSAQDDDLESTTVSSGSLAGAWSLAGDQLTISDVDTSGLDVETSATMNGEELELPAGSAEDAIEVLPPTLSTVGCSADRLSLTTTLSTDEDDEHVDVVYTLRR